MDILFFVVEIFEDSFEVIFQLIHRFQEMIIEVFLFTDIVPQMFGGIEFRTVRRQQFYTDVGWLDQCFAAKGSTIRNLSLLAGECGSGGQRTIPS